ncbi:unnamed protein product [Rotaria sordida]|uniref:Uncharacterized protein n=1 Tax=Rotaria sordida TaxID=392033 RepID=A0A815M8T0_9BILA|nr:unnamed protein product [Rotaria sordida]CAF1419687.1 unnamed protein product [Rotaria sordida]
MKPYRDISMNTTQTNTTNGNIEDNQKENNNLYLEIIRQQQELVNKLSFSQRKFIIEDRVLKAISGLRLAIIIPKDIKYNKNIKLKIKNILQTY